MLTKILILTIEFFRISKASGARQVGCNHEQHRREEDRNPSGRSSPRSQEQSVRRFPTPDFPKAGQDRNTGARKVCPFEQHDERRQQELWRDPEVVSVEIEQHDVVDSLNFDRWSFQVSIFSLCISYSIAFTDK